MAAVRLLRMLTGFHHLHRRGFDRRQRLTLATHANRLGRLRSRFLRGPQLVGVGVHPDETGLFQHRLQGFRRHSGVTRRLRRSSCNGRRLDCCRFNDRFNCRCDRCNDRLRFEDIGLPCRLGGRCFDHCCRSHGFHRSRCGLRLNHRSNCRRFDPCFNRGFKASDRFGERNRLAGGRRSLRGFDRRGKACATGASTACSTATGATGASATGTTVSVFAACSAARAGVSVTACSSLTTTVSVATAATTTSTGLTAAASLTSALCSTAWCAVRTGASSVTLMLSPSPSATSAARLPFTSSSRSRRPPRRPRRRRRRSSPSRATAS